MPAARSEFFPNARPSAPPNARPASVKQTVDTATVANSGASGNRSEGNAKPTPRESRLIESEAKIIPLGFSTSNSCPVRREPFAQNPNADACKNQQPNPLCRDADNCTETRHRGDNRESAYRSRPPQKQRRVEDAKPKAARASRPRRK